MLSFVDLPNMLYSRAFFVHTSYLLAQPAYLTIRYFLGHERFSSRPSLGLTIHAVVWVYIATRISIPFFTSPLRRVPSPPGETLLQGHLFLRGHTLPMIEDMVNNTPNDGLLVLWGPLYLSWEILPTRPDTLLEMVNSHNYDWEKPPTLNKVIIRILGEGLATVEGAKHKAMRRVVTPAFSGQHIRQLAPLFFVKGVALTEAIAQQARKTDEGVFELMNQISRATLDIIGVAGVGLEFNSLDNETSNLAKLYTTILPPPVFFVLADMFLPQWILRNLRGTAYRRTVDAQSQLRKEVRTLLEEKKAHVDQDESALRDKDIIATIMRSGDYSDDYLVDQMLTFLAAGHDTTTSAVSWAISLLSQHPEFQDRLRLECNRQLSHIPTSEVDAPVFDTENMPFLTAVCNETLRLYPPAPVTPRYAAVPTIVGGVHIPKGTQATISPWAMNRSRAFWGDDAGQFNPDRWLDESNATGGAKSPYAFLTFLHGPRSCIGQNFARLEMKCLLAALVMRLRFEPADPDQKLEVGGMIVIKPKGGLKLKVHDLKGETGGGPA